MAELRRCTRCRTRFDTAPFCEACLRDLDADPAEKRSVLFPRLAGADALSC
jgi:hypothetical protein